MRAEEEAGRARDQLTATQADIGTAVERVQRVDGALSAISTDVRGVHTLLAGIADDNRAQSRAITEVSMAVGAMDQATQQNAAMVEQTSAAARNLTAEVAALSDQAAKFRIEGAQRGAGAFRQMIEQPDLQGDIRLRSSRSATTSPPAPVGIDEDADYGFAAF